MLIPGVIRLGSGFARWRGNLGKPQLEADHVVARGTTVVDNCAGGRYVADHNVVLRWRLLPHDLQQIKVDFAWCKDK